MSSSLGLTTLSPESYTSATHRNIINIDIVFVHGLNGDALRSCTSLGPEHCFWPKDILPSHFPTARIMTFGYDANVLTDTSNGRIAEFSENLLGGLAGERSQSWEKARPLIFICHSMGGIVVKRALVVAHARKRFHGSTGDATRSIVFMATPHRGSGKAYWGEMGRRLSSLLRGAPPGTSTLEEIRAFSAVLEDINADFTNIASAYNLVWFYKTV